MRKTSKLLSVCMVAVLLLTILSSVASALSYNPTVTDGQIKFIMRADKTTVNPGDTVAISFYVDPGEDGDFGAIQYLVSFNKEQLSPASQVVGEFREFQNQQGAVIDPSSGANMNLMTTGVNRNMTEEEKAYYTGCVMMSGRIWQTGGVLNQPGNGWTPDPSLPQMTYYMKVSETVQPGEEIWVGFHESSFTTNMAYIGRCGGGRIPYSGNYDLTNSMVKLTVAEPAAAGPVVEKDRAQVKMTATSATTVADAFTFRVISKITDADWDTYFANTGTDDVSVNAIQKLGFVAYKGTEGFNMDTAKAVAMGTATDANYEAKYTDYVQKVDESSDAYFGARIEFTSAETRTDVTYVGVVEYTDAAGETAYAFYPAEYTAALESNFDAIAAAYLAQYPYAG